MERRTIRDRRQRSTPLWSFYTFFGRRRRLRRKSDQEKGAHLDRYSPALFILIVFILILNIFDSLFTMILLDLGGLEFNPVVHSIMALQGDRFWIWKFLMVSGSIFFLCLHRGYNLIRKILIAIGSIYLIIVLYQIFLITHLRTPTP